jgi:hypothetical protein
MFDRLSGFFDKRFRGTTWRDQEKEFWDEKIAQVAPGYRYIKETLEDQSEEEKD